MIEKYKIQYFCGAPVIMNFMLDFEKKSKFKHQVEMWAAGSSPPPHIMKRLQEEAGVDVKAVG